MNIGIKYISIGASISAAVILLGSAAIAEQPAQTLQQALQTRIAQSMRMPTVVAGQVPEGGIARVSFTIGADGATHDVKIARRSGSAGVDREAVRMIAAMRGLPPGVIGKQVYAVLQYRLPGTDTESTAKSALDSQVMLARNDATNAHRLAQAPQTADAQQAKMAYVDPALLGH